MAIIVYCIVDTHIRRLHTVLSGSGPAAVGLSLASPKSVIRSWHLFVARMLPGLRSRWMTRLS